MEETEQQQQQQTTWEATTKHAHIDECLHEGDLDLCNSLMSLNEYKYIFIIHNLWRSIAQTLDRINLSSVHVSMPVF